jgi:hypothetical protein
MSALLSIPWPAGSEESRPIFIGKPRGFGFSGTAEDGNAVVEGMTGKGVTGDALLAENEVGGDMEVGPALMGGAIAGAANPKLFGSAIGAGLPPE